MILDLVQHVIVLAHFHPPYAAHDARLVCLTVGAVLDGCKAVEYIANRTPAVHPPVAGGGNKAIANPMSTAAIRHLSNDHAFAGLIRRVGPPRLAAEIDRRSSPYEALMRAIAHQQLHGRAAQAILARFIALHPGTSFPLPAAVLQHPEAALRACGFSAGKIAALRDICVHALNGTIPTRRGAVRLSDEALVERLTGIRGVGRWTVEMLLIFGLGRPDVLPVDDFGVREGFRILHGLEAQPKPRALAEIGAAWAPYRSLAAWYLWRAAERAKPIKTSVLPPVRVEGDTDLNAAVRRKQGRGSAPDPARGL